MEIQRSERTKETSLIDTALLRESEPCSLGSDTMTAGSGRAMRPLRISSTSDGLLDLDVPAIDLTLARPKRSTRDVYDWACNALRQLRNHPEPKMRRVASVIEEAAEHQEPLKSYGGSVCVEELVSAASVHPRDVAPGQTLRRMIDVIGQSLVSFPHHLDKGVLFSDPVAALYAVRIWAVPVGRHGRGMSLNWFKDLTGVPKSAARQNLLFRKLKQAWLDDGTLVLASRPYGVSSKNSVSRQDLDRLKSVINTFDVAGGKLPESVHRKGALDYEYLADLAGVSSEKLHRPDIKRHLQLVREQRGVALPGFDFGSGLCAHLLIDGLNEERKIAIQKGNKKPEERCSGLRSAFMNLLKQNGLTTEDAASCVFGNERYTAARERAAANFENEGTRRNFVMRCDRWKKMYDRHQGAAISKETLATRLDGVLRRQGISFQEAADAAGCSSGSIRNWCRGGRVSVAMMPMITRLETFLGLREGDLVALVRETWQGCEKLEVNPHWYEVPYRFRRLLPPHIRFQENEEIDAAAKAVEPLVHKGTKFAQIGFAGRSDEYRLPSFELPQNYLKERAAFVDFKTKAVPAPLLRARDARWKAQSTITEKERELDHAMRFALAPCSGTKNSGLGLPHSHASLVLFTVPGFLLRYFAWQATHLEDVELPDGRRGEVTTSRMRHVCWTVLSLTHPETGYLTQQPAFAKKLQPIHATPDQPMFRSRIFTSPPLEEADDGDLHILSPAEVAHATTDWRDYVSVARATAKQILEHIDEDTCVVRDAMANAEGLLHGDAPAVEYLVALQEAEKRIRAERTGIFLATDLRNLLMCHLSLWTAFRPKNLYSLIFTGDDSGEIWKEDGYWHIKVSYRKFKNWRSAMLFGPKGHKQDFTGTIKEAGLIRLLDEWFYVRRPFLVAPDCNLAFTTRKGKPFNPSSWYDACRQFGARYLVWNPVTQTGLKGVVSINPYVHRAIRATDILLNSRSPDRVLEAAYALQTSEEMIRAHYGLLIPEKALSDSRDTYATAWKSASERAS